MDWHSFLPLKNHSTDIDELTRSNTEESRCTRKYAKNICIRPVLSRIFVCKASSYKIVPISSVWWRLHLRSSCLSLDILHILANLCQRVFYVPFQQEHPVTTATSLTQVTHSPQHEGLHPDSVKAHRMGPSSNIPLSVVQTGLLHNSSFNTTVLWVYTVEKGKKI